jgi:hypothetical protein
METILPLGHLPTLSRLSEISAYVLPWGMQKDTEPSSNAIRTLVAIKRSFEKLRMIISLKYKSVSLGDPERWLKDSESTYPRSALIVGDNAFAFENVGS